MDVMTAIGYQAVYGKDYEEAYCQRWPSRKGGVMHSLADGQVVLVRPIILEEGNAYGCVLSWQQDIEAFVGIMCGHGGSHWLCPGCADRLWQEGGCYTVEGDVPEIGPPH